MHVLPPWVVRPGLIAAVAAIGWVTGAAAAPSGSNSPSGRWLMTRDGGSQTCELSLRGGESGARVLAMPTGCRRAIPALKAVRKWSTPSDSLLSLDDANGGSALMLETLDGSAYHAVGDDGTGLTMRLVENEGALPDVVDLSTGSGILPAGVTTLDSVGAITSLQSNETKRAGLVELAKAAAPAPKINLPTREVAGQYAVMRGDKDTGCMVTLDPSVAGPRSTLKAHLAPACRDQGIIIFDPIGWQMTGSRIVLTARKGHTLPLEKGETGIWSKDPADMKSIGLKRL